MPEGATDEVGNGTGRGRHGRRSKARTTGSTVRSCFVGRSSSSPSPLAVAIAVGVGITWKTGRVPLSGCRLTSVDEGEYVAGNRAILDTLPLFPGATRLRAPNRMTVRRRGAMRECDARTQGAPICGHIGATEDEAVCRAARSGVTSLHSVRSSKYVVPGARALETAACRERTAGRTSRT
jgi:hypothetical protein